MQYLVAIMAILHRKIRLRLTGLQFCLKKKEKNIFSVQKKVIFLNVPNKLLENKLGTI